MISRSIVWHEAEVAKRIRQQFPVLTSGHQHDTMTTLRQFAE